MFTSADLHLTDQYGRRPRDRRRRLRPIPERARHDVTIELNSSFERSLYSQQVFCSLRSLHREKLDFLFPTETWQKDGEFIHLNELCPAGCSVIGKPHPCRHGGGLAAVFRKHHIIRTIDIEQFSFFESLTMKVGFSDAFHCCVIYRPPRHC